MTEPDISQMTEAQQRLFITTHLANPWWRLNNLYKVENEKGDLVTFKMRPAQESLFRGMHKRNIILKARQLGFSTAIDIYLLDQAMFNKNLKCAIVAQDLNAAGEIFRTKIEVPFNNLPAWLKSSFPVSSWRSSSQGGYILFSHGSSIQVATSFRSGTVQRLHISEHGKICAKYPAKARELRTGTLNAASSEDAIVFDESTAEGVGGDYYDMVQRAIELQQSGIELDALDFKFHFFPWFRDPKYATNPPTGGLHLSKYHEDYFAAVELQAGVKLTDAQKNWYVNKEIGQKAEMKQEFPSCIAGDVWVSTPSGMVRMKDVVPDGLVITDKFDKGVRATYTITTKRGYQITCTDDHPILTPSGGYVKMIDGLGVGDWVCLDTPNHGNATQVIEYQKFSFMKNTIEITEDFAEFIGIYMGDGSFHNGTISIACDAKDEDTIARVEQLMSMYFDGSYGRTVGSKKGCYEIRKSSLGLVEPFQALGIIQQKNVGGWKRNICVPDYIMNSPRSVSSAFIRGLFEADGFAARNGQNVKFFSKHDQVCRDVQVLLLSFGIDSTVIRVKKTNTSGYDYWGSELTIRAIGARKYATEIGFISQRKQDRVSLLVGKPVHANTLKFDYTDEIASIDFAGEQRVYDITTVTHNFIANGITVHNCPQEAFLTSGRRVFDSIDCMTAEAACSKPMLVYEVDPVTGTRNKAQRFRDGDDKELIKTLLNFLLVWELPDPDGEYVIGADVAEGLEHGDRSSFDVANKITGEQVAHWYGHLDAELFAMLLAHVGKWYNTAYIMPERNNHGHAVLQKLRAVYPTTSIYSEQHLDRDRDDETPKLGWLTTAQSKPIVVEGAKTLLREGSSGLNWIGTVAELNTYVYDARGRMNAQEGCFDDQAMSWMLTQEAVARAPRKVKLQPLVRPKNQHWMTP